MAVSSSALNLTWATAGSQWSEPKRVVLKHTYPDVLMHFVNVLVPMQQPGAIWFDRWEYVCECVFEMSFRVTTFWLLCLL